MYVLVECVYMYIMYAGITFLSMAVVCYLLIIQKIPFSFSSNSLVIIIIPHMLAVISTIILSSAC